LTVELVPQTCWYSNVRSELSKDDWDLVRRAVYRQAGRRCEVCGGRGPQHHVECHEVWVYDDQRHIQRLERMIALCPACHEVKHMGHANVTGHGARARRHLAEVNGWSASETERYVERAFAVWQERSQHEWQLDISALDAYGVAPAARESDPAGGLTIRPLSEQEAIHLLRDAGAID
jgi:5-methylcytosine-specific restriction endonuclease McrA